MKPSFEDSDEDKYDILNVMPDYGGAYLWGAYESSKGVGPNIADSWGGYNDWLPISKELQLQFHKWQWLFDNASFQEEDENGTLVYFVTDWSSNVIDWDWKQYHQEGIRLSRLLKQEVGDKYRVIYVKPYEDPDESINARIEVLLDGTLNVLND